MRLPRTLAGGIAAGTALVIGTAGFVVPAGATVRPHAVGTITIGTENFPEEVILGNIYNDVLKNAGFSTKLQANLGPRASVIAAFDKGQLDLVPEYAGSLLISLNSKATTAATKISTDIAALNTQLAKVKATTLTYAPATDTNVFVVTKATAKKYNLTTLSSLKSVASKLTLGAPTECPQQAYCSPGLKKVYGITFGGFKGLEEDVAVSALKSGSIQVAELFSSDGTVSANGFVALGDDKNLQPADHIVPIILKKYNTAGVAKAINGVDAKLTTSVLESLNIAVNVNHQDAATVAKNWLVKAGLIKA